MSAVILEFRTPSPDVRKVSKHAAWAPDGCWRWTGTMMPNGYGVYRGTTAHRRSYEAFIGPIPAGLHLDHLCRNRWCVRPDHLEPVTQAENNRRAGQVVTHCPRDHEYTPENTRITACGGRACRACQRERNRRRALIRTETAA